MNKLKIKSKKFGKYYTVGVMDAFQELMKEINNIGQELREDGFRDKADFLYFKFSKDVEDMKKYINSL